MRQTSSKIQQNGRWEKRVLFLVLSFSLHHHHHHGAACVVLVVVNERDCEKCTNLHYFTGYVVLYYTKYRQ